MAKSKEPKTILLAWSKHVRTSDGNDPLGLALRVGARLTNQLLHCITSITPRARYYSFLPWCIAEYRASEKGKPRAQSLRNSIRLREHGLVLGSVLHHQGSACAGGGLTGSDKAIDLYRQGISKVPKMSKFSFSKNPAIAAYLGSLVNIGIIKETDQTEHIEGLEEEIGITFDDIELTQLGAKVASMYGIALRGVVAAKKLPSNPDNCTCNELIAWGRKGGLCELRQPNAPDRKILRDLFFANEGSSAGAHVFRRDTLLLLLHLTREFDKHSSLLNANTFNDATYFGRIVDWGENSPSVSIKIPRRLEDITLRWRMYHVHYYCWFALETLFSWIVERANNASLAGINPEDLVKELASKSVSTSVMKALEIKGDWSISSGTLRDLWSLAGCNCPANSSTAAEEWDEAVHLLHPLAEARLDFTVQSQELNGTASGALIALLILLQILQRYLRWENTDYGNWLSQAVRDDYLDITVPLVLKELRLKFADFTTASVQQMADMLIRRFVVSQHEGMSYTKSNDGTRAFFHCDENRIYTRTTSAWRANPVNGRLTSALRILSDLAYIEEDEETKGQFHLTAEGAVFLASELKKG